MFYAGYNKFGINFVYSSEYWHCYAFQTKKERDDWVSEHEYNPNINSGYIACSITVKDMEKIVPCNKTWQIRYVEHLTHELKTRDL